MQKKAADESALKIDEATANKRIVISEISPQVDDGRYPAKFCVGDTVDVGAIVFSDGHVELAVDLEIQPPRDGVVTNVAMQPVVNDHWTAKHSLIVRGAGAGGGGAGRGD